MKGALLLAEEAKQRGSLQKLFETSCTLKVSRVDEIILRKMSNKGLDGKLRMC